jgi:hypothetical protein
MSRRVTSHNPAKLRRVFIGHGDGVGSTRWDGHTWIDEGRPPDTIYETRGLTEDPEGFLWVSGGDGKVLRVEVAATGMRDSKVQIISQKEGLIEGSNDIEVVAGSIFASFGRSKYVSLGCSHPQVCRRQPLSAF